MEDEEFIAGRIDTGFIEKWKERRRPAEADETDHDMALIAAAMAFATTKTALPAATAQPDQPSRWAAAGRAARLDRRP